MERKVVKFTVFADFHYKKGMYISTVDDLKTILDSANKNGSDLVIHAGDMCNDYQGSPELTSLFINNPYSLPVYGIFGNHELETTGNKTENVIPFLTNREVAWGTPDGRPDGVIGHYYFDVSDFRFICLDTNYSYSEKDGSWEKNGEASYGPKPENIHKNSLGPDQLAWFGKVLEKTADEGKKAIILTHASFDPEVLYNCDGADTVRKMVDSINEKKHGTVLMCINGHSHTNHIHTSHGVLYFDVNTVRNGVWISKGYDHYGDTEFAFTDYDRDGNKKETCMRKISDTRMAKNTWYFEEPLFAHVTVYDDGEIEIAGKKTNWYANIDPNPDHFGDAQISSYKGKLI